MAMQLMTTARHTGSNNEGHRIIQSRENDCFDIQPDIYGAIT